MSYVFNRFLENVLGIVYNFSSFSVISLGNLLRICCFLMIVSLIAFCSENYFGLNEGLFVFRGMFTRTYEKWFGIVIVQYYEYYVMNKLLCIVQIFFKFCYIFFITVIVMTAIYNCCRFTPWEMNYKDKWHHFMKVWESCFENHCVVGAFSTVR